MPAAIFVIILKWLILYSPQKNFVYIPSEEVYNVAL